MKKINTSHYIFWSLLFLFPKAFAYDNYQSFKSESLSVNMQIDHFRTTSNFDSGGSKVSLPDGNYFQVTNLTPWGRWQIDSDWAFLGGLNIGISESADAFFTRNNSSVNQLRLGTEYLFLDDGWFRTFFRLSGNIGLSKIDSSSDGVANYDGAHEIIPEVIANLDFEDDIAFFVKAGFNYRTENLSKLFLYGAGGEIGFSEFRLGAALLGKMSVGKDSSPAFERQIYNANANAGSMNFYSVDPNRLDAEFNVNYIVQKDSYLKAFAGFTVLGSNTSAGIYLGTAVYWVLESKPAVKSRPVIRHTTPDPVPVYTPAPAPPVQPLKPIHKEEIKHEAPKVQQPKPVFKEDISDEVDQRIFKPTRKEDQQYIQQIEGDDGEQIIIKKKENKDYKIKLRKK